MQLIDSRNTGNGSVDVYKVQSGYAVQVVRNDGTQINRTAGILDEALVVQSELFLAEPELVDKYADEMYDE